MTETLNTIREALKARLPETIVELRAAANKQAPGALKAREGYTIRNDADTAVIRIYDEIWFLGVNADDFVRDLDTVTASKIRVEINSPGGDVFDGIAIYNALRNHPAHVTTRVDGLAASIASVIFQAGDHRVMLDASQMMIHNAWSYTVGDTDEHADTAAVLAQQDDIIAGIYASKSGKDRDHFRQLMSDATWLTDERAVEEGLADEIVTPDPKPAAKALHDQISETSAVVAATLESVERVVALRAEAGKTLSQRNLDGLDGLRGEMRRIDGLLDNPSNSDDDIAGEYLRFVAHMQGVS